MNLILEDFYYAENKDSSYDLKNDYPSGYSHGSIRFKYYDLNEGFTEEDMLEDLKKFLELFNELASKVTKHPMIAWSIA